MLYRLWEQGTVASLDDPLERYASTFTINNPWGMASAAKQYGLVDGLEEVGPAPRPSPVTLRRMASQLSGEFISEFTQIVSIQPARLDLLLSLLLDAATLPLTGPDTHTAYIHVGSHHCSTREPVSP